MLPYGPILIYNNVPYMTLGGRSVLVILWTHTVAMLQRGHLGR